MMKLNPSTDSRALKGICTSDGSDAYFILISDLEDVMQKMVSVSGHGSVRSQRFVL